jgi:eukaryotic-like serine/threonine-protein kinase
MSDEIGKRIGDYQILNELGSGGMGRVWRVRNLITDRIEAMKVLLPDLAGRQDLAARFQREIKLMASLEHPNIAALRTAFTDENRLVMVMEYVEGTNLADRLHHGSIPVADALNYIAQTLSALSYAHERHVIHRDIKPSNMMLTPQGMIKLMDFGIARAGEERSLTMTGTTLGSLSYMSPEQVKGEATDARSDLYSVGVSLYELVTGQRPFQAASDYAIMAAHVKEMPKPPIELQPALPPALSEIILMAIAKEPAQRFQTAAAFRNALGTVDAPPVVVLPSDQMPTMDSIPPAAAVASRPLAAAMTPVSAPVAALKSATPIALPAVAPAARPGAHRGLYMTLGALIVLAVLVAAGIYIPRGSKTQADSSPSQPVIQPVDSTPAPPAAPPTSMASTDATQPTPAPPGTTLAAGRELMEGAGAAPSGKGRGASAKHFANHDKEASPLQEAGGSGSQEAAAAAEISAQLDRLEKEVDQLSNRAAAVNSGLDHLQQQQASAGYGLRGDMIAKQASMKNNLSKAEEAVQRGDVARAEKFTKAAESDVEALERFLGR